jgi:hypothetical protein
VYTRGANRRLGREDRRVAEEGSARRGLSWLGIRAATELKRSRRTAYVSIWSVRLPSSMGDGEELERVVTSSKLEGIFFLSLTVFVLLSVNWSRGVVESNQSSITLATPHAE